MKKLNFEDKIYILDGAMGTMLQRLDLKPGTSPDLISLTQPGLLASIHSQYVAAGADIIYANTFGANPFKLSGCGRPLGDIIDSAVSTAKSACKDGTLVALDVGPLGELLEPMGSLTFEKAYKAFEEIMIPGARAGADLVVIETMTDLYEVKAAVLAAKEHTNLPVFVSMTFEETGRTFAGVTIESMVAAMEGLNVDAIGINCSLGPAEIYPLAKTMCRLTNLPVLVKPNAGLPDPATGAYGITPEQFAETMSAYAGLGVSMVGGCCGTDPDYISQLKKVFEHKKQPARKPGTAKSVVCSATKAVAIDHVTIIGERINPTGKKRLKQALIEKDYGYLLSQAREQIDAGAEVLDVNVGIPEINEAVVLPKVVKQIQAVTDAPLQIDSSDPAAIEAALRAYNGKAIVNSVNGEETVMNAILPIVKKYGAAVVGLTLDGHGIPATAEERFAIAGKILAKALDFGIPKENVWIDCLTLTVSAQQEEAGETLKALRMVKERLGLCTVLGVSNISFGLPCRPLVNRTFLALALENGLDLPIINPNDEEMTGTIDAFELLHNRDRNAENFISRYGGIASAGSREAPEKKPETDLFYTIENGLKTETARLVKAMLENQAELEIVDRYLIPALDQVGREFEKGAIFLPQMMQAAVAAQEGFAMIQDRLSRSGQARVSKGKVIMATVKGDIHDIGKNIVKIIMENYGFEIIDLGKDVPIEKVVEAVLEHDAELVGLSALMTTSLKSMEETIAAVSRARPSCKSMVGGAVLTPEYAKKIGADYYCKDAMKSVEAAKAVFGK